ncbi:MAG: hypothetical protein UD961_03545 [Bacteroidales bacterium]|jgi:hypothetical protein|nr:hypothetical protein [Bacteroidales bacterium]
MDISGHIWTNLPHSGQPCTFLFDGKNAGTRTYGVSYGNGSRESLSDADWLTDDFGKLLDIVSE